MLTLFVLFRFRKVHVIYVCVIDDTNTWLYRRIPTLKTRSLSTTNAPVLRTASR